MGRWLRKWGWILVVGAIGFWFTKCVYEPAKLQEQFMEEVKQRSLQSEKEQKEQQEKLDQLDQQVTDYLAELSKAFVSGELANNPRLQADFRVKTRNLLQDQKLLPAHKTKIIISLAEFKLLQKSPAPLISLAGMQLGEVDLRGLDLRSTDLSRVNLIRANLSAADLSGADLTNAYLNHAILIRTQFNQTDLSGVQAQGAFFQDVDLRNSNLSGVNFQEVRFCRIQVPASIKLLPSNNCAGTF